MCAKHQKSWSTMFSSSSWERTRAMTALCIPVLTETTLLSMSSYLHPWALFPPITSGKTSPMQLSMATTSRRQSRAEGSSVSLWPFQEKEAPSLAGSVIVSSHFENNRLLAMFFFFFLSGKPFSKKKVFLLPSIFLPKK